MRRLGIRAGIGLMVLVMIGVVALVVVSVATYDGDDLGSGPSHAQAAITRPAVSPADAAYDLELMHGADAARCTWIEGTVSEFECVFREGRERARARVVKSVGMDETIGISDCVPLNSGREKKSDPGHDQICPESRKARSKP
jgi:hypothetical protein